MANPYLSQDESVILATDNVVFRSVTVSALVLTNKRILLIRADGEVLSADEILLSKLRTVAVDRQAMPAPVLALSYIGENGDAKQETLTFLEKDGKQRTEECVEWAGKLDEQIVPSLAEGTILRIPPLAKEPAKEPDKKPDLPAEPDIPPRAAPEKSEKPPAQAGISAKPPSSQEILAKHDRPAGLAFPKIPNITGSEMPDAAAPAPRRKFIAIAALVIIVIAVVGGALLFTQFFQHKAGQPPAPAATSPAATTVPPAAPVLVPPAPQAPSAAANATQAPAPASSATPTPTPSLTLSASQIPIPSSGVWVYVKYAGGNFTGTVGAGGDVMPVRGTGERFYQLVTKAGIVRAIIQKLEGSGEPLTVDIYQDGARVGHGTTAIPYGEVNLQFELLTATPATTVVPNATLQN